MTEAFEHCSSESSGSMRSNKTPGKFSKLLEYLYKWIYTKMNGRYQLNHIRFEVEQLGAWTHKDVDLGQKPGGTNHNTSENRRYYSTWNVKTRVLTPQSLVDMIIILARNDGEACSRSTRVSLGTLPRPMDDEACLKMGFAPKSLILRPKPLAIAFSDKPIFLLDFLRTS